MGNYYQTQILFVFFFLQIVFYINKKEKSLLVILNYKLKQYTLGMAREGEGGEEGDKREGEREGESERYNVQIHMSKQFMEVFLFHIHSTLLIDTRDKYSGHFVSTRKLCNSFSAYSIFDNT